MALLEYFRTCVTDVSVSRFWSSKQGTSRCPLCLVQLFTIFNLGKPRVCNVANTHQYGTAVILQTFSQKVPGLLLATDRIHKLIISSICSFQQGGERSAGVPKYSSGTHCLFSFTFMLIPFIRALLQTLTVAQEVMKSSTFVRHTACP